MLEQLDMAIASFSFLAHSVFKDLMACIVWETLYDSVDGPYSITGRGHRFTNESELLNSGNSPC